MQEVGSKVTGPRSIFATKLALREAATEDEAYRAANITPDKRLQFQILLSDAETAATTWSLADTESVTNQLVRKIDGITLNEQMQFKQEFSLRLIEFEAWWKAIGIEALQKTIQQHVIHFEYPKMRLVSVISQSIRRMRSGDNITTDSSERLHTANVKDAYRSSNKVNYIWLMLKHTDQCTGLDDTEETLS